MLSQLGSFICFFICVHMLICFALVNLNGSRSVVCSMDLFFFGGSETAALVFTLMQSWCVGHTSTSAVLTSSAHVCMCTYTLSFTCILILFYFSRRLDAGCFVVLMSTRVSLFLLVVCWCSASQCLSFYIPCFSANSGAAVFAALSIYLII